jgi:HSP20 family protein
MTMQRWDPVNEIFSLRQAMDRLLDDAVIWPGRTGTDRNQGGFGFPVDLVEHDNELVVQAAVPGVRPDDVNLQVQGNTLTIDAEVRQDSRQPQGQPSKDNGNGQQGQHQRQQPRQHYQERRYGRFFRQIALPVPVDSTKAEARFDNGVLTVTLPKAAEARQRRIPITAGSQAEQPQQLAAGRTR